MARYLVKNNRVRRVQTIFGRTLASALSGGKGMMWLTEGQWESDVVTKRIDNGRLVLVQRDPPLPDSSAALVVEESAPPEDVVGDDEAKSPVEIADSLEDEEDVDSEDEEDGEVLDDIDFGDEEDEEVFGDVDSDGDPSLGTWTFAMLEVRSYRENQKLAKKYDVKASGTEVDIINRLLELQEAS